MKPILITGGAGFIGTNLAARLLSSGQSVVLYDNVSRCGVEKNLHWLRAHFQDALTILTADTRDREAFGHAVCDASAVFHFAAQVAVTTSLSSPELDFDVNVRGTLHLLETLRAMRNPPPLVFTSTNKVYGSLPGVELGLHGRRYEPVDPGIRAGGVGEEQGLEFYSPYGCSKGSADQYILDYARSFGIPAVVFRMSCIYGPHQHGNEDQGWLAHFLLRALRKEPITIYGDGRQVRDILFIDDLVEALLIAKENASRLSGAAFNMGGGPQNSISLLELIDLIAKMHGELPPLEFADWRIGDQRYYVSDCSKFQKATGWAPTVCAPEGLQRLYDWLKESLPS
ncbi:MAG: GDP-mannose 4,6-dehydratase [Verrucomicrobia bacterium]|nr:GDP-mannose 4,6-dehydratase [Verrucomicrobiota bacterium]